MRFLWLAIERRSNADRGCHKADDKLTCNAVTSCHVAITRHQQATNCRCHQAGGTLPIVLCASNGGWQVQDVPACSPCTETPTYCTIQCRTCLYAFINFLTFIIFFSSAPPHSFAPHSRLSLPLFSSFLLFSFYSSPSFDFSSSSPIYRVSQEECARLRESVPYVKVYRYNPKHRCPKLNGYGDNGQRSLKLWQLLHTYWLPNTY